MSFFWDISKSEKRYNHQKKGYHLLFIGKTKDFYIKNIFGNRYDLTTNKEDARIFTYSEIEFHKDDLPYQCVVKENQSYKWG